MKTNQLLTKVFALAMFAGMMLSGSSVFAQVKIGTNPATIESNSNLEVEATTAGRKVKIDKTTGQLTITDGTQGTGKVLISDANGGASWQPGAGIVNCGSFEVKRGSQSVPDNNPVTLFPDTEAYDPSNAYNPATGEYTVPATGIYVLRAGVVSGFGTSASTRVTEFTIVSAAKGSLATNVTANQTYGAGVWDNAVGVAYLTAGDKIRLTFRWYHVAGAQPTSVMNVTNIMFSGSRIDCNSN